MAEGVPDALRELLLAMGPSGYETGASEVWRSAARAFSSEVSGDTLGSSVARVPGGASGRRLALVGHIDEIGLMVTHIDDDGFLWFRAVGGWDAQVLIAQRVRLDTREGRRVGVVGRKAIHVLRDEERKKVPEVRDLHIDIGARDGEEARNLVRVGDVAVIDSDPVELPNRRLAARALDDRLGAYIALEAARLVAEAGGAEWEVVAVASVQEEIGQSGARTSAYALKPTVAVAVEVTHATDAPGSEVKTSGAHPLGSGPVIGRGSILHPHVFELLHEAAEAEGIPFSVEASSRGTGTDADVMFTSRAGVPSGLVSVPLRYMHSPVELVALEDIEATARLLAAFARRLTADVSFER